MHSYNFFLVIRIFKIYSQEFQIYNTVPLTIVTMLFMSQRLVNLVTGSLYLLTTSLILPIPHNNYFSILLISVQISLIYILQLVSLNHHPKRTTGYICWINLLNLFESTDSHPTPFLVKRNFCRLEISYLIIFPWCHLTNSFVSSYFL